MADVPPEHLRAAIERHLAESQDPWFPAIGRLRKLAAEAADGTVPGWEAAWEAITRAARVWFREDRAACLQARAMVGETLMPFVRMLGGFSTLSEAGGSQLAVLQSNFRSAWTGQKTAHESTRALPEHLRPAVGVLPYRDADAARIAQRDEQVRRLAGRTA